MPVLAATATYSSFYIQSNAVYLTAHDAVNAGTTYAGTASIDVGQYEGNGSYDVHRGGLFFNTSSIPSDAAIVSATLSLYDDGDFSQVDFNLTIVNGSALSNPAVAADYGALLAATASAGSKNTSTWALAAYNDITLNATGLGYITKAGTTKLALRSSREISSSVPASTTDEFVLFIGASTANPAKLTISYASKGNLFVKAENLHYVSDTGVERYIPGIAV